MEEFFSAIYGTAVGKVALVTQGEEGVIDSQRWCSYPDDLEFMSKYCAIRSDEDVYCTVNVFSEERRSKDDVNALANAVYADLDTCHPDNLRVPPSIVVQTSDGHWHGWWVLDEPVPAKDAADTSKRIYVAHADQGCDRGWAIGKLLRVPGTSNTKRGTHESVTAEYSGEVFTLDTINAVYSDVEVDTETVTVSDELPTPVSGEEFLALEEVVASAGLTGLYLNVPSPGESWSERAYRLEADLFRTGMTDVQVFSLMLEAACNKYNPEHAGKVTQTGVVIPKRSQPELVLWREVQRTGAQIRAEEEDIQAALEDPSFNGTRTDVRADFLSMDERRYCQETPTFIDRYVSWVASKTDSATTYQHTMAFTVLAAVFGGRGFVPLRHGDMQLNLWTLLLGDTTRTRKTTAKNIGMSVIHEFERQIGEQIDIGSDASTEALHGELGKRDGKSSLMHKDEINGWFASLYQKQYMAGVLEAMTELYDGRVPVSLRVSKDSGNRIKAKTSFSFIGVGIRSRTAEVLTKHHFESGFLARMLWAVADPPPRRAGSESIEFRDAKYHDEELSEIVADLVVRASRWPEANPAPITMDVAAHTRYNQWAEESMARVEQPGVDDIVIPSLKRLQDSTIKSAALLAMYDQTEVITLKHLLPAMLQAERWFGDMIRMANEVSASEFERRLDIVEKFIASSRGGQAAEVAIKKKFPQFKPRDWAEILDALRGSGRIRVVRDGRVGYYEVLG